MPRYYFDVADRGGVHRDEFGDDFADLGEACAQARSLVKAILRDDRPGADHAAVACEVRDGAGRTVYRGRIVFRGTRDPADATAGRPA